MNDDMGWVPEEMRDPEQAAFADAGSLERTLQALVAARFCAHAEWLRAQRPRQRVLERHMDELNRTGTMLMSLLRNEREKAR